MAKQTLIRFDILYHTLNPGEIICKETCIFCKEKCNRNYIERVLITDQRKRYDSKKNVLLLLCKLNKSIIKPDNFSSLQNSMPSPNFKLCSKYYWDTTFNESKIHSCWRIYNEKRGFNPSLIYKME